LPFFIFVNPWLLNLDEPVKSLNLTLVCHSRFRENDNYLRMHQP